MADAIKIKVILQGDIADIRFLMPHPMETGLRKNDLGQVVPSQFIQTFTLRHNGVTLVEGQLNTSISKNPLFGFKARGIKAGDKLSVAWVDSKGDKRSDEIVVA